jgi:hypothetical protein
LCCIISGETTENIRFLFFFFTISSGVLSFSPSINGKRSARLENERKFDAKEVHKCGEKEKIFDAGLIFEPRDIIIIKKKKKKKKQKILDGFVQTVCNCGRFCPNRLQSELATYFPRRFQTVQKKPS